MYKCKWIALLMASFLVLAAPVFASQDAKAGSACPIYLTIMGGYDTTTVAGIGLRDKETNTIVALKTNFLFFATMRAAFSLQRHNPLMVYVDAGAGWRLPCYPGYNVCSAPYAVFGGGIHYKVQDHFLIDLGLDMLITRYGGGIPFPSVGFVFYL